MWPFSSKKKEQDWGKFLGDLPPPSRKQRLIEECKKYDVSVHIDDASEASTGIYAELRGVASEAELERRLVAKRAVKQSAKANWIAGFALLVSLISLAVSFWSK
ncbi:hypothetical protein GPA19_22075 [Azoarcus indigens]|uniref:hypothetical protein n=1 Tax=Azoarcus indigens TaxID=29545 RepID=UPI001060186D|nr:hypothetical protein [Azoarcus indigens]NMG67634.1 hypothetical protein [Azoarcus indigens]